MNARDAFKANLPKFTASVRGNVVADAKQFVSKKSGEDYVSFKVAHSFAKDGVTAFIKVIIKSDDLYLNPSKGDYAEVSGDYTESENESNGTTYINRTMFSESVVILGYAAENGKAPKNPTTLINNPKSQSKAKR